MDENERPGVVSTAATVRLRLSQALVSFRGSFVRSHSVSTSVKSRLPASRTSIASLPYLLGVSMLGQCLSSRKDACMRLRDAHIFTSTSTFTATDQLNLYIPAHLAILVLASHSYSRGSPLPTRTLTTTTIILLSTSQSRVPLRSLRLKHLSLSFNATTIIKLRTATYSLVPLFSASLTSLSLTHLPSIRRSLLSTIAGSCPELESLELSVVERLDDTCCIDCLEESACCIVHSALGDRTSEESVEDLAVSLIYWVKVADH